METLFKIRKPFSRSNFFAWCLICFSVLFLGTSWWLFYEAFTENETARKKLNKMESEYRQIHAEKTARDTKDLQASIRQEFPNVQFSPDAEKGVFMISLQSNYKEILRLFNLLESKNRVSPVNFEVESLDFFSENPDLILRMEGVSE